MSKNKFFLITAIAINNIGDTIFDLFIAWELSAATGQFMNAVYVIGTSAAFRAALSFFAGAFVDRHPKKRMMIYSHLSSLMIIGFFGIFWGLIKQYVAVGIIFVLFNDINNELFTRSYVSMTSDMFENQEYIQFQSYSNIVMRIVGVGGAALAGIFIDNISNGMVFIIDICTYFLSLLLIQQVVYKEHTVKQKLPMNILKNIFSDIKYTFRTIFKSSYLQSFMLLMFVLNLAYGYIPQILPVFKANSVNSAALMGGLKSAITVGEIIGLAVVSRVSRYVSGTFKVSMIMNIIIISLIYLLQNPDLLIILFALYGVSDSLTQPLFGYTVSNLDYENRGKLFGGIDAVIMFSPSIGIYAISAISSYHRIAGAIVIAAIFITGFLIISLNKRMRHIVYQ